MKYLIVLFFILISFNLKAQEIPSKYIGIWSESKDNCKNDIVVNPLGVIICSKIN